MSATPARARAARVLERRRTPRYPLSTAVEYAADGLRGNGLISEVSAGGVYFKTDQVLPVGKRIELRLEWPAQLDNGRRLWVAMKGKVLRSSAEGAAVQLFGSKSEFHVAEKAAVRER